MSERLNIWGMKGCLQPNGSRCRSCCLVEYVPFDDRSRSAKPRFSQCPYQGKAHDHLEGCALHGNQKPFSCSSYSCSELSRNRQCDLIVGAYALGDVNRSDAIAALMRIDDINPQEAEEILDTQVNIHNFKRVPRQIEYLGLETI